jgi:hypothetical protein
MVPPSASNEPAAIAALVNSHDIGGHTLTAALVIPKSRRMVSEPGYAIVQLRGDGIEVEVAWMGRNTLGRPENYRLQVLDAARTALPTPDAGPQFGGQSWTVTLTNSADYQARLLIDHWVSAPAPGRYTVHAETTVRARRPGQAWQDVALSVEAPLEIVADDPVALAAVFQALGDVAVGSDHDAAGDAVRQLEVVGDPRVVEQWLRVVSRTDYSSKFAALRGLARSTDDRALAAIVGVAKIRAADLPADGYSTEALRMDSAAALRLTAAQALSESKHPGALDALLAMKADPYDSVRLTVLHRAARLADAAAVPLLRAFHQDTSALVRDEAGRYLGERGATL